MRVPVALSKVSSRTEYGYTVAVDNNKSNTGSTRASSYTAECLRHPRSNQIYLLHCMKHRLDPSCQKHEEYSPKDGDGVAAILWLYLSIQESRFSPYLWICTRSSSPICSQGEQRCRQYGVLFFDALVRDEFGEIPTQSSANTNAVSVIVQ